jgi:hypothetical protein
MKPVVALTCAKQGVSLNARGRMEKAQPSRSSPNELKQKRAARRHAAAVQHAVCAALGLGWAAGEDHVELISQGLGGAMGAEAELVGDVPAGGWGKELVGREGAALAS